MEGEVVVGCSRCVVMGVIRKGFYHQKRFHGSIFLEPLPPQHPLGQVSFTDRHEQCPAPPWPSGTVMPAKRFLGTCCCTPQRAMTTSRRSLQWMEKNDFFTNKNKRKSGIQRYARIWRKKNLSRELNPTYGGWKDRIEFFIFYFPRELFSGKAGRRRPVGSG